MKRRIEWAVERRKEGFIYGKSIYEYLLGEKGKMVEKKTR